MPLCARCGLTANLQIFGKYIVRMSERQHRFFWQAVEKSQEMGKY